MQDLNIQTNSTLVDRACSTVDGFSEQHRLLKQQLSIHGRTESTFVNYARHLAAISLHHNRLPTTLSDQEIDEYLYYLQQKYKSHSETYFRLTVYSLRFLFKMSGLTGRSIRLPSIRRIKRLPVVLSKPEMVNMMNRPRLLKHRVLIALLYGCGLRCAEAGNVRVNDLDFDRAVLHVRQGKGKKDRYMPLGRSLLLILQNYIEIYKPKTWLFAGRGKKTNADDYDKKCSRRGMQWAVHAAAKLAGIKKDINMHTLRHTFATHMLEDGLDIVSIKEMLGHSRIETTLVYLHIAQLERRNKFSPIDNLQGIRVCQGIQCKMEFSDG
jgi:site-specific recombinase XerD